MGQMKALVRNTITLLCKFSLLKHLGQQCSLYMYLEFIAFPLYLGTTTEPSSVNHTGPLQCRQEATGTQEMKTAGFVDAFPTCACSASSKRSGQTLSKRLCNPGTPPEWLPHPDLEDLPNPFSIGPPIRLGLDEYTRVMDQYRGHGEGSGGQVQRGGPFAPRS